MRSYVLVLGARTWLRVLFYALAWGIAPGLMCVLMLGADLAESDWLAPYVREEMDPATYTWIEPAIPLAAQHALLATTFLGVPLVCLALVIACLRLRAPRPAKIDLDAWGVTEWDGDAVRTAVAWAGAKVRAVEIRVMQRGSLIGTRHLLSIVGPRGFAIHAHDGVRGPTWTRRRKTLTTQVMTLDGLGPSERSDAIAVDPRDARRGLAVLATIADVGIAATLSGVVSLANDWRDDGMAVLGLAAALLAGVRALRPLVELVRLVREGAAMRDAQPIRLLGASGNGLARCADASGREATIDLSAAPHPDARLAERTIQAFARLDAGAAGSPYRGTMIAASAIETQRDRDERRRLVLACAIELALRALSILALVAVAIVLGPGMQAH